MGRTGTVMCLALCVREERRQPACCFVSSLFSAHHDSFLTVVDANLPDIQGLMRNRDAYLSLPDSLKFMEGLYTLAL